MGAGAELLCAPLQPNTGTSLRMGGWEHFNTSIPHPLPPPLEYLAVIFIDILQQVGGLRTASMPQWFLSSSLLQPDGRNWDQRGNKGCNELRFIAGF